MNFTSHRSCPRELMIFTLDLYYLSVQCSKKEQGVKDKPLQFQTLKFGMNAALTILLQNLGLVGFKYFYPYIKGPSKIVAIVKCTVSKWNHLKKQRPQLMHPRNQNHYNNLQRIFGLSNAGQTTNSSDTYVALRRKHQNSLNTLNRQASKWLCRNMITGLFQPQTLELVENDLGQLASVNNPLSVTSEGIL